MRERAIQFGEANNLVGIVTEPDGSGESGGPSGSRAEPAPSVRGDDALPGVLLLNAGILHRVGPSRMNVELARRLGRHGFTCLRFDFSGIGDSGPRPDPLSFEESSVLEIQEAMDHLEQARGISEFVLVGLCSGADAAFHGALADRRVVGLVPIDGHAYRTWRYWVHRYLPRLFRWESWKNLFTGKTYVGPWIRRLVGREDGAGSEMGGARDEEAEVFQRPLPARGEAENGLRRLIDRNVEMLHVFSAGLDQRYNYPSQFHDMFRSVDFRDLAEVRFFGGADHTFTDLDQLEELIATVSAWARRNWARRADTAATARSPGERAA